MQEFYRNPTALGEHFILSNLNREIEAVLRDDIFSRVKTGKVLDIGCGQQPLRKYFVENGFQYKGLDYKQNNSDNVDFIAFIDGEIKIDESFDVIVCTEVLEHVFNWDAAFRNMERLCNKGGLILITCPMIYPLHEEPYDYWRPTPYALEMMASKHGMATIKQKKLGGGLEVLGTLLSTSYFYPESKSLKHRLLSKLAVRLRSLILNALKNGSHLLKMESPFFMSNLFLLEKKGELDED